MACLRLLMIKFGRYELLEELGRGGFGVVYNAEDQVLGRVVALKVLHPALVVDPTFLDRFKQEARLAARLDHANIVQVFDFGEIEGNFFISMAYMSGGSLRDLLSKGGALNRERAMQIFLETASGLSYAHSKNVIHRDLKPGNILLDEKGTARVSDLGFAKVLTSASSMSMSVSGGLIGTPAYMAPELWLDEKATKQTDQYSLACILVEMLTGKPLFDGESTPGIMTKHFRPLELPGNIPEQWKPIVEQALEKKPEERFGSVAEFVSRLELPEKKTGRIEPAAWTKKAADDRQPGMPIGRTKPGKEDQVESFPRQPEPEQHSVIEPERSEGETRKSYPDYPTPEPRDGVRKPAGGDWREKIGSQQDKLPVTIALALLAVLIIFLILRNPGLTAKPQPTSMAQTTSTPTKTATPTRTAAPTRTALPTATPGIGSSVIREQDGMEMVYVPAGVFEMGSDDGRSDEKPVRQVYLDEYWIDKYEVSNAQYALCVAAGACFQPSSKKSWTRGSYYGNPEYDHYPVMHVSWNDAKNYCKWAGGELPTEAQWENAARGPDGRTYPWGNDSPDSSLANYNKNEGDTTKVGNYPAGASPYGALDMAGNLWEWVRDNYGAYQANELDNPTGAKEDGAKVIRGGSVYTYPRGICAAIRYSLNPASADGGVGFRCSSPQPNVIPTPIPIPTIPSN